MTYALTEMLRRVAQIRQTDFGVLPSITARLIPSMSFPNHY
jgi:hypothetical protein